MLRVATDLLRPGMKLGRTVMDRTGRVLLTAHTVLQGRYIAGLMRMGIPAVYIANALAPDVVPPDMVSEETRLHLAAGLRDTVEIVRTTFSKQDRPSLRRWSQTAAGVREAVNHVVDEVLAHRNAMVHLTEVREHDGYTLGHSINVCILSVLLGTSLGYSLPRLRDLGLGAVLHDVGKITIPEEILNKEGPLTAEELVEMRAHPQRGFEMLYNLADISLLSAHVAWQHHERWYGGGYPRGLKGEEIQPYARLVATVDVYDAMTADRPYRRCHTPERALRNMRDLMSDWFEPQVLAAFLDNIALYPVGTLVELTTGEIGVVVAVLRGYGERPTVRILRDPQGRRLRQPFEVELRRDQSYAITRVLVEPEDINAATQSNGNGYQRGY